MVVSMPINKQLLIDREAARERFDDRCKVLLGISGAEFLRRLDAGLFNGREDEGDDLMELVMLAPLGR